MSGLNETLTPIFWMFLLLVGVIATVACICGEWMGFVLAGLLATFFGLVVYLNILDECERQKRLLEDIKK